MCRFLIPLWHLPRHIAHFALSVNGIADGKSDARQQNGRRHGDANDRGVGHLVFRPLCAADLALHALLKGSEEAALGSDLYVAPGVLHGGIGVLSAAFFTFYYVFYIRRDIYDKCRVKRRSNP